MKKRIIALVSAIAMLLPMAFANVASAKEVENGVSVVYNEVKSTSADAWYDIYVKGYEGQSVLGLQVTLNLKGSTVFDLTTMNSEKADRVKIADGLAAGFTASWNNMQKVVMVKYADTNMTPATWNEDAPIASCKLPLVTANTVTTPVVSVSKVETTTASGDNAVVTPSVDATKTQAAVTADATVVDANADAPKATYWTVEANLVEGADTYWYANVDGADKKVLAAVPSVAGNTVLGLIVEGDATVTNVKVVQ